MYLVIGNNNDRIIGVTDVLDYQDNGNVLCGEYAIAEALVSRVEEVESVPEYVVPIHYAYKNGEYIQLVYIDKEDVLVVNAMEQALNELGVTTRE